MSLTALGKTLMAGMAITSPSGDRWTLTPDPEAEDRLLAAIAQVETGTIDTTRPCLRIGKRGERSAWQITSATWKRYETAPFAAASPNAATAELVARLHLRWLEQELRRQGLFPTVYFLALGWNGGPGAWRREGNASVKRNDYAARIVEIDRALRVHKHTEISIHPCGTPGNVWLQHRDGQGGTFPSSEVAPVMHDAAMLRGYFNANF